MCICRNYRRGRKIPARFKLNKGQETKMIRFTLIAVVLCLCVGCRERQLNPAGTLEIEAAIVYSLGGPQPVAAETFYLMTRDVAEIIKQVGIRGANEEELFSNLVLVRSLGSREGYKSVVTNFDQQVKRFSAYSVTTDFTGKARFTGLPVGQKFYLFGTTQTRSGHCVWNQEIVVAQGTTRLRLSQNNAVYAR